MLERHFHLHGVDISLLAEEQCGASAVEDLLDAYCQEHAGGESRIVIELRRGTRLSSERLYPDGPSFIYDVVRGYQKDGALLLTDGHSRLEVREGAHIQGEIHPRTLDDPYLCAVILFNLAVQACLRHHELFYAHAAALVREGRTILIAGNANSGKTTLSLALMERGLSFLSDDAVYFQQNGPDVVVRAFRRPLHLDRHTLSLFPRFASAAEGPFDRVSGTTWDLDPRRAFLDRLADQAGSPSMLVLPTIVKTGGSTLRPIGRSEALEGLLPQSALIMLGGKPTRRHLEALVATVRGTASFSLALGPDAYFRPEVAADRVLATLDSVS